MKSIRQGLVSLVGAGILGQLINIIALPIVSRLYNPDDFGVFSVFNSALLLLIPFAGASYPYALVLAKSYHINYLFYVSILMSLAISFVLFLSFEVFDNIMKLQGIKDYSTLIVLYFIVYTIVLLYQQAAIRQKDYNIVSISNILNIAFGTVIKMTVGITLAGIGSLGLVLGQLAGLLAQLAYFKLLQNSKRVFYKKNKKNSIYTLSLYSQFPQYNIWVNFVSALNLSAPVFILGIYFSSSIVGLYAMARTIMGIPGSVLGSALMNVFYPEIKEKYNNLPILHMLLRTLRILLALFIPTCIIMYLFLEDIFRFMLGDEWGVAGKMAFYIMVWQFFAICSRATSPIYKVLDKMNVQALIDLVFLLVKFVPLIAFYHYSWYDAVSGILYICIVSSIQNALMLFISLWLVYKHDIFLGKQTHNE